MNTEERLKILEMIANKQVTPEEGARLLEAVGAQPPAPETPPAPAGKVEKAPVAASSPVVSKSNGEGAKRLRIHVVEGTGTKVNVNLPLSLMEVGLRFGGRFVDELKDFDSEIQMLMEAVRHDVTGKIVEVDDEDSHVEIYIE
ncbi:MAG TPA: hypothetical protein VI451_07340 [Anaerolineales bacterium]|nr:hypothetical protein [Anaerolineales bacterium]